MIDYPKLIEEKKADIVHYEGCLDRYMGTRWVDYGRRSLAAKHEELKALEDAYAKTKEI